MSLVLDASLALSWFFEDERSPAAGDVLDRVAASAAIVPCLWRLDVASGFQAAIRRKRIDHIYRDDAIRRLAVLPITINAEINAFAWTTTVQLAQRFGLTPYDAAYLELAQRRALPLATLDQDLRAAATVLGTQLLGMEG